jgi:hypothetical protein
MDPALGTQCCVSSCRENVPLSIAQCSQTPLQSVASFHVRLRRQAFSMLYDTAQNITCHKNSLGKSLLCRFLVLVRAKVKTNHIVLPESPSPPPSPSPPSP